MQAHFAPNSKFDFHKYIKKSMEDDFKLVLGIRFALSLAYVHVVPHFINKIILSTLLFYLKSSYVIKFYIILHKDGCNCLYAVECTN